MWINSQTETDEEKELIITEREKSLYRDSGVEKILKKRGDILV